MSSTLKSRPRSSEVAGLLRRITEGATTSGIPLSEVLRLCMRLGNILHNSELSEWAKAEAEGYRNNDTVPDYRTFETEVRGTFFGPFGSGYKNAPIPRAVVEAEHRDKLFAVYMKQPVGELETLTKDDRNGNSLTISWPGDAILYYQQKEIYEGLVLGAAWQTMTTTVIAGVLEIIRARVLEFALAIEDELGIDTSNVEDVGGDIKEPDQERVSQIFYTTIQGGDNIALGNSGPTSQQAINVRPGDLPALKDELSRLGLTPELINGLEKALVKDVDSEEQPGPATKSWLAKLMIKIGNGTVKVVGAAAGALIEERLRRYLGLPPSVG